MKKSILKSAMVLMMALVSVLMISVNPVKADVLMTAQSFANKCIDIATNYPTTYGSGGEASLGTWVAGSGVFSFDCNGLIKSILWGWNGSKTYLGGATYNSNGVPDLACGYFVDGVEVGDSQYVYDTKEIDYSNISEIETGEILYMPGHVGVYVGNGMVVESTLNRTAAKQGSGVQLLRLANTNYMETSNVFTHHSKLVFLDYGAQNQNSALEFAPSVLDFGTIYAGYESTVDRVLTIKNTGSSTVALSTASCPSGFKVKSIGKNSLAAGESTTMVIAPKLGLAAGNHDADFYVTSDKGVAAPVKLKFSVQQMEFEIGDKYSRGCNKCESKNVNVFGYKADFAKNYINNGDGTHRYEAIWTMGVYCTDCDYAFFTQIGNNVVTVVEEHEMWAGKCMSCNYTNWPCEHFSEENRNSNPEVIGCAEYFNERFHYYNSRTLTKKYSCWVCGESVFEPYSDSYWTHWDYDSDGKCDECGGGDGCIFPENSPQEFKDYLEMPIRYENINADTHTKFFDAGEGAVYITDGEIRMLIVTYRNSKRVEPHTYKDGICACGKQQLFHPDRSIKIPAALTIIESESFYGSPAYAIIIPSACKSIGSLSFAYCSQLEYIQIPASVTQIAADAFKGCSGLTICSPAGSYAQTYAQEHGIAWMEL